LPRKISKYDVQITNMRMLDSSFQRLLWKINAVIRVYILNYWRFGSEYPIFLVSGPSSVIGSNSLCKRPS